MSPAAADRPLNQRDRNIAVLAVSGMTTLEISKRLGTSVATVDRSRMLPATKALIAQLERDGLQPQDTLRALMASRNEITALRASVELGKLTVQDCPNPAAHAQYVPLPPGCRRVTTEDHLGKSTVRLYELPEADDAEPEPAPPVAGTPGFEPTSKLGNLTATPE